MKQHLHKNRLMQVMATILLTMKDPYLVVVPQHTVLEASPKT